MAKASRYQPPARPGCTVKPRAVPDTTVTRPVPARTGSGPDIGEIRRTLTQLAQAVTHLTGQVEALIDSHAHMASQPVTTLQPRLLSPAEAATVLGISEPKIRLMVASGELQSVKVGHLRRIPVEVIDAYIASLIEEAA